MVNEKLSESYDGIKLQILFGVLSLVFIVLIAVKAKRRKEIVAISLFMALVFNYRLMMLLYMGLVWSINGFAP